MKNIFKYLILFAIGGIFYYTIECIWRGYSHPSMAVLGGLCFIIIGHLNEFYTWDMSLISQMFVSSIVITVLELLTGIVVNKWFQWGVWDYSHMPYNFLGQICLLYTNLWFLLSLVGILLDDYVRFWVLKEEKPHYKIL